METKNRGFIMKIVILIVAIIALKYFLDFDVVEWFKSDRVQSILGPVINFIKSIYHWLDNFVRNMVS